MAQINNSRIMQWNCQVAMNKESDLLIIAKDFDIVLFCETFLKAGDKFALKNFNVHPSNTRSSIRRLKHLFGKNGKDVPFY